MSVAVSPEPLHRPSVAGQIRRAGRSVRGLVRVFRANPLTLAGFVLVVLIALTALVVLVAPHLLTPYAPDQLTTSYTQPPSLQHPFGTDGNGIDIYSETLYALPLDLAIAFAIAGTAMIAGGGLGLAKIIASGLTAKKAAADADPGVPSSPLTR